MAKFPVLLVTGASSGIGAATAQLFAREGYRVALAARRQGRLQELVEEIQSSGGEALSVATDVSRLEDIREMVDIVLDRFGQIDVLFNNAGFGRLDWLEVLDPQKDIQAQIQVNFLGTIWTTQAVLPVMIKRRSGHIINMGSLGGYVAAPTYTAYAASKFAVRGFSEALRREVGIYGISVSAIYPGGVATEFSKKAGIRRKTGATTPASLRLSADDVARAILRLVRKPRRELVIPWSMRFVVWFNILFPGLVDWIVERQFVLKERD
jgi:short-subunit dehydrogenase